MLKKLVISLILVAFVTVLCLPNMIYAMDDIIGAGGNFISKANETVIDETELSTTSNYIYNILFTIAVVLAIAIGMVIGIQFIMGSVDDKAKIKETLVPYIIGVFIVFASFTIWKIVITIGNDVTEAEEGMPTYGIIDVNKLTNEQLKSEWNKNDITKSIGELYSSGLTLEQAINALDDYERAIYNTCKNRGLLDELGIVLK